MEDRIKILAQWMLEAEHLVVFTGAGIGTESGLPDFRGPDGLWTRRAKGLSAPEPIESVAPVISKEATGLLRVCPKEHGEAVSSTEKLSGSIRSVFATESVADSRSLPVTDNQLVPLAVTST